jgi:hypothetical protein
VVARSIHNYDTPPRGLVNEPQGRCLKDKVAGFQRGACSRNIRTILLGGVQVFLNVIS